MRFEFHPEALDEYEAAARYYAGCQEGLELRFIACAESAIQRLSKNPEHFRLFEADIRRCLVHIFPYAVLFTVESDYVLIIAVMHCSREPGYWRHRMERNA